MHSTNSTQRWLSGILASKEAQQKLQEAVSAIVHDCYATITSLQQIVKSAQTTLQTVSAGMDDSPAASGKDDNWELTAYRVSGLHCIGFVRQLGAQFMHHLHVLSVQQAAVFKHREILIECQA